QMLILSCSSKLRLLEGTLQRRFPNTLQVYGTVMAINRGNPAAQEVLVDSWPDFKVVLTRPRREVKPRCPLGSAGAVNWGQTFCILGNMCPKASGRVAQQLNIHVLSGPNPRIPLLSLDVSHADLLNETWAFGGNEKSRKYLASLIRHFPSVCLLDAAGHPVSWIASDPFGAMGPGYTLPQHRGRGYMGMLNNLIAKRLHALGYPSYGYVAVENYPMQSPTGLALPHSPIPTFRGSVLLS
uniref:Glycine N-acyltransferase-like protein n=1 Tax=Chrysemys picta bellii TaxID=8478 RepID=A0A8C3FUK5_CHRPI